MRKTVKIIHTLAACGMIGGLVGYLVLLRFGARATPAQYADLRQAISVICDYLVVYSMGVTIVSGFVSMAVHKPFRDLGWVWLKALTAIGIFEATMAAVRTKASFAAEVSMKIASGEAPATALEDIDREWGAVAVVIALAVANVVVGVWRPPVERWGRHGR